MELSDIKTVLRDSGIHTFFPLEFQNQVKESSAISVTGGTVSRGGVFETDIRVITRENHPNTAIQIAKEIREYLYENVKGAFFNGNKILQIETLTPEPLTIGEEGGLFYVSYNYRILEG